MKLIQDIESRYTKRVNNVLKMDIKMGLYTEWKSDVSGMCREMLDCMLTYFPKLQYVQIKEAEEDTGIDFNEHPDEINSTEAMNRYMEYPNGWYVISINTKEMEEYRKKLEKITSQDSLYNGTVLEPYKNVSKKLSKVLYQYGLMHVFYHEYGHAMDGHILAKNEGAIEINDQTSKALEYTADLFAVNQMCKRFYFDNLSEICVRENEIAITPIREEMALMALGVYIFLDLKYERDKIDSYNDEIAKSKTHLPPFLRQYFISGQFVGAWKSIICLSDEQVTKFNQEVIWYLDAYEKSEYGKSLLDSPFFIGEDSSEIPIVQNSWNKIYEKLIPYVNPGAGIGKVFEYNVLTKQFE